MLYLLIFTCLSSIQLVHCVLFQLMLKEYRLLLIPIALEVWVERFLCFDNWLGLVLQFFKDLIHLKHILLHLTVILLLASLFWHCHFFCSLWGSSSPRLIWRWLYRLQFCSTRWINTYMVAALPTKPLLIHIFLIVLTSGRDPS